MNLFIFEKMEYTKRRRLTVKPKSNGLEDIYQHDLQMYDFPPRGELLLTEFEQLAKERLRRKYYRTP